MRQGGPTSDRDPATTGVATPALSNCNLTDVQSLLDHDQPSGHQRTFPRRQPLHRQPGADAWRISGLQGTDRPDRRRGPRASDRPLGHAVVFAYRFRCFKMKCRCQSPSGFWGSPSHHLVPKPKLNLNSVYRSEGIQGDERCLHKDGLQFVPNLRKGRRCPAWSKSLLEPQRHTRATRLTVLPVAYNLGRNRILGVKIECKAGC